jgi:PiT family inorganic phosphate transporter
MKAGAGSLVLKGLALTGAFIVLSPLLGLVLGFVNYIAAAWAFRKWRPDRVDRVFRKVQLVSAAAFSFGHGMNDAQKTMGIIFALLLATGHLSGSHVPFWIVLMCHAAIGLGTLTGGWRIVRTMSMRITPLKPIGGSCAEFAGAVTLVGASLGGIPVSTTHTITGAIMGVGATHGLSAVRWGVARSIIFAWVLTIPASALVSALTWKVFTLLRG